MKKTRAHDLHFDSEGFQLTLCLKINLKHPSCSKLNRKLLSKLFDLETFLKKQPRKEISLDNT